MGCQLTDPRQRDFDRIVGPALAGALGAQQTLEQQSVLADPLRTQADVTFQHFAGARIDHPATVRPAPSRTMDPLHHVPADVERIFVRWQNLDPKGIDEPGLVESFGPPGRPFDQRAPDRLRCAGIDVEHDRFFDRRTRGGRVDLFETMALHPAAEQGLVKTAGEIAMAARNGADPRIVGPWPVSRRRQADQGMVLHQRQPPRIGRYFSQQGPRLFPGEGEHGFEFEVVGKGQRRAEIHHAAGQIDREFSLATLFERDRDLGMIDQQKGRQIDQNPAVALSGDDFGRPQHRSGEGFGHRPLLRRIFGIGPKGGIQLLEKHLVRHPAQP